jgi:antitoxin VapB
MEQVAKLFANGRSQAVRLPRAFQFPTAEVFIRKDPATGDVILSSRPSTWDGFFAVIDSNASAKVADSFSANRIAEEASRDPFEDWVE